MSLSALAYKKLEVIQNVVSYHVALERETKLVENVLISNTEISPKPSNRGFESFWTCKLSGTSSLHDRVPALSCSFASDASACQ